MSKASNDSQVNTDDASNYLASQPFKNKTIAELIPFELQNRLIAVSNDRKLYSKAKSRIKKWLKMVKHIDNQIKSLEKKTKNENLLKALEAVFFPKWRQYEQVGIINNSVDDTIKQIKEEVKMHKKRFKLIQNDIDSINPTRDPYFMQNMLQLLIKEKDYTALILEKIRCQKAAENYEKMISYKIVTYLPIMVEKVKEKVTDFALQQQLITIINCMKDQLLNNLRNPDIGNMLEASLDMIDEEFFQKLDTYIDITQEEGKKVLQLFIDDLKNTIKQEPSKLKQAVEDILFAHFKLFRKSYLNGLPKSTKRYLEEDLLREIKHSDDHEVAKIKTLKQRLNTQIKTIKVIKFAQYFIKTRYRIYNKIGDYLDNLDNKSIKKKVVVRTVTKINQLCEVEIAIRESLIVSKNIFSIDAKEALESIILSPEVSPEECQIKLNQIKKAAFLMHEIKENSKDVYDQLNGKDYMGATFPILLSFIAPNSLIDMSSIPTIPFLNIKEQQLLIESIIDLLQHLATTMQPYDHKREKDYQRAAKKIYTIITFGLLGKKGSKDYGAKAREIKEKINEIIGIQPTIQILKSGNKTPIKYPVTPYTSHTRSLTKVEEESVFSKALVEEVNEPNTEDSNKNLVRTPTIIPSKRHTRSLTKEEEAILNKTLLEGMNEPPSEAADQVIDQSVWQQEQYHKIDDLLKSLRDKDEGLYETVQSSEGISAIKRYIQETMIEDREDATELIQEHIIALYAIINDQATDTITFKKELIDYCHSLVLFFSKKKDNDSSYKRVQQEQKEQFYSQLATIQNNYPICYHYLTTVGFITGIASSIEDSKDSEELEAIQGLINWKMEAIKALGEMTLKQTVSKEQVAFLIDQIQQQSNLATYNHIASQYLLSQQLLAAEKQYSQIAQPQKDQLRQQFEAAIKKLAPTEAIAPLAAKITITFWYYDTLAGYPALTIPPQLTELIQQKIAAITTEEEVGNTQMLIRNYCDILQKLDKIQQKYASLSESEAVYNNIISQVAANPKTYTMDMAEKEYRKLLRQQQKSTIFKTSLLISSLGISSSFIFWIKKYFSSISQLKNKVKEHGK